MNATRSVPAALAIGIVATGVSFFAGISSGMAQDDKRSVEERLDRIDQKLDLIIKHLGIAPGNQEPARADAAILPSTDTARDQTTPQPANAADPELYKAGAVAIAYAAPERQAALAEIPADSVGSFVYSGGALPLNELSRSGVRYNGLSAVELQSWLKVDQPGRTQFAVEYRATTGSNVFTNPTCIASIWLEDRSIGSKREPIPMPAREEKTVSLVFGADLQPGLYKFRAWLACTRPRDLRILNAELLIKTPGDMNLRVVTGKDLLHQR